MYIMYDGKTAPIQPTHTTNPVMTNRPLVNASDSRKAAFVDSAPRNDTSGARASREHANKTKATIAIPIAELSGPGLRIAGTTASQVPKTAIKGGTNTRYHAKTVKTYCHMVRADNWKVIPWDFSAITAAAGA